jgi:ribosomal protein L12E/L44/L45/RPP1/RPP2
MARVSQENHTIEAVIAALSAAPRGNRELDCMIACALGTAGGEFDQIMMRELVSEGFAWDSIVELWDDRVPAYTSSLDAALDEENIRCVIHSSKRKALSVNLAAAAAATAMPGAKQAGSPAAPDQADEPQAPEQETKEWSILF